MANDQITKVRKMSVKVNVIEWPQKTERLALIKERYEKLVLEPRREIEFELEKDLAEENVSDLRFPNLAQV